MPALSIPAPRPTDDPFGFDLAPPSVGAAHRAGLARGLVFVLLLAVTSLAAVGVPVALQGPHWVEGTAPVAGPLR